MNLAYGRVFWALLLPALALLLFAWVQARLLAARETALAAEVSSLRAELARENLEPDASSSQARRTRVLAEAATLRDYAALSLHLADYPLLRDAATRPFTLIAFERERALATETLRTRATETGLRFLTPPLEIFADPPATTLPASPRRRWAQLVLAREVASRALAARVDTYEALPLPSAPPRDADAADIRFSARVTGDSARLQTFLELIALGTEPTDPRLHLEHILLRKEGTTAPDHASATVVVTALLPPP